MEKTKLKPKYYPPDTEAVSALQSAVPQVSISELRRTVQSLKRRNRRLGAA